MIVPLGIMYNALNNNNNPSTQPQFQSITIPITKSLSIRNVDRLILQYE